MNSRVPVHIQPTTNEIKCLPQRFNGKEFDTLSSLNLPMNESGTVQSGTCARIPLGYRIILPRGFIGMIKERRTILEKTPFLVLSGIIDCNAMGEDTELKQTISVSNHPAIEDNSTQQPPVRMHPEVILYLYNCGPNPLEYTKGQSIVQLFVKPVCESQIQILQPSGCDQIGVPLRYT